jgi:hypothetical protein
VLAEAFLKTGRSILKHFGDIKVSAKGFPYLLKAQCWQNSKYIAADIQAKSSVQTVCHPC